MKVFKIKTILSSGRRKKYPAFLTQNTGGIFLFSCYWSTPPLGDGSLIITEV